MPSFTGLYESAEHSRNLGHFASIANIATSSGNLGMEEEKLLKRFAEKLDISDDEYDKVLKNPTAFPLNPPDSAERRLERLHDLFKIIFADNVIDETERFLVEKYAIGLGYTSEQAQKLIKRSIEIFSGGLSFDDFQYLINRKS